MPELEEKVVMGLVKKLGMEKEKVEEAHIAFLDKHPEGQMTRFDTFLAALAALGLPWSLVTYLSTVTFIVLDSKPSSPFQPERHVQHRYRPASRDLLSVIIPCASPSDRCRWGSLKDTLVLRSNKFRNVSRRFPL